MTNSQVLNATLKLNLANTDYKGTKKFTWLAAAAEEKSVPVVAVEFAPLITKAHVAKVMIPVVSMFISECVIHMYKPR